MRRALSASDLLLPRTPICSLILTNAPVGCIILFESSCLMQCILPTSKDVPASSLNKKALAQRALNLLPHHGNSVHDATRHIVLEIQAEHGLTDDTAAQVYGEVIGEVLATRRSQPPRRWVSRPVFPVDKPTAQPEPPLALRDERTEQLQLF